MSHSHELVCYCAILFTLIVICFQRKVIKKQTKMLMSESLNEDKLEHVFCGLAEIK